MPEHAARADEVESPETCPHVNRNDARCASRFSLGRIDQAFSVCFGSYRACPMYHRLNGELHHRTNGNRIEAAGLPVITLTSGGLAVPLRPTGS